MKKAHALKVGEKAKDKIFSSIVDVSKFDNASDLSSVNDYWSQPLACFYE